MNSSAKSDDLIQMIDKVYSTLVEIRERYGWASAVSALEQVSLRLMVSAWASKAPGSVRRLKQLCRALSNN